MDEKALRVLEYDKIVNKLISYAASDLGKEIAGSILPVTEPAVIERRLKDTSDGVSFIIRRGSPPLGGIHDIRGILKRVEVGSVLGPGELLKTGDTLRACRNLKNYASDNIAENEENTVKQLIACLTPNKRIEEKISMCILSEEEIADGASSTLSNVRRQIRQQQDSIKDKLNDLVKSSKYQKFMQESIVTMRGDRYVVPVKQEHRTEIPGLVHDSSSSGATIFVEPMAVVEANNQIKQLKIKEQLEIERILQELTADVDSILTELKANISTLAQLDFIFAKARLSLEFNCVHPIINRNKKILIKKGRHPLLDKHKVVPIDIWIGESFSTLVVTGPNTGGKTVTLKTLGLFCLMTQAGLHIPANDGTEMCIFEKIFADIGDEQSIEQSLSTFSSHMTNIVGILEKADDNSLALFDELGAGTDPTEGAALAMSILEYLHQTGTIAVATTHYSELKVYAISTAGVENASCEFDIQTLRPTYKLLIGVPGKSNAFAISKRLGLTDDLLERAKEFLTQEDINFEDLMLSIEKNRVESEKEKMKAQSYRLEIEKLRNEVADQKSKLDAQKEKALREAREEARKILLQAKRDSEEMLEEIRRIQRETEASEMNKAIEDARLKLKTKVDAVENSLASASMQRHGFVKPPQNLKPGDSVLIVNLNQKGTVVTPPDSKGEAIVLAGIMKINVHVTNLKLVDEQKNEISRIGLGKISVSKTMNISREVDVRGMNLEMAVDTVGKFLDDAVLAGLHEITIIHGKGTGTLRAGIHQELKSNHCVKAYRLGRYGEGENGVTVVEL